LQPEIYHMRLHEVQVVYKVDLYCWNKVNFKTVPILLRKIKTVVTSSK